MRPPAATRPACPGVISQLVRFGLVGAVNTALTLATYSVMLALHAPAPLAGAVGWGVGATNGYLLNRAWTFRDAARGAVPRRATSPSR